MVFTSRINIVVKRKEIVSLKSIQKSPSDKELQHSPLSKCIFTPCKIIECLVTHAQHYKIAAASPENPYDGEGYYDA